MTLTSQSSQICECFLSLITEIKCLFHCLHKSLPLCLNLLWNLTNQCSTNIWESRSDSSNEKIWWYYFLNECGEWMEKPFNKLLVVNFRGKNKLFNDTMLSTWLKEEVMKIFKNYCFSFLWQPSKSKFYWRNDCQCLPIFHTPYDIEKRSLE